MKSKLNVLLVAPELEVSEAWFRAIMVAAPGVNLVVEGQLNDEAIIRVCLLDNYAPRIATHVGTRCRSATLQSQRCALQDPGSSRRTKEVSPRPTTVTAP